jgi:hypothetical protein
MAIVVAHFYNEEFLLPFWLEHNTKIFDHGVLIDYQSTDNSVEIIKQMAPSWEIRSSVNEFFGAEEADNEVMAIEREFENTWKMSLNITEFPLFANLEKYIQYVTTTMPGYVAIRTKSVIMVDTQETRHGPMTSEPLIIQRHHGYIQGDMGRSSRTLHNHPDGFYELGRHDTRLEPRFDDNNMYCLWYGWSPIDYVKPRKLQIQKRLPEKDIKRGLGMEHLRTEEELEEEFNTIEKRSRDLLENEGLKKVWTACVKSLYPGLLNDSIY